MELVHAKLTTKLTHAQLALHPYGVETRRGLLHWTCHGFLHRIGISTLPASSIPVNSTC
jgi:hypothetical protein